MRSSGLSGLSGCWGGSLQGQLGGQKGSSGGAALGSGSSEENKGRDVVDQVWNFGASFELLGGSPTPPCSWVCSFFIPALQL